MPKGKNVQIKIKLDSTLDYTASRQFYHHHYEDNERIIDDSVTIKKGQKEVSLYAYIQEERWLSILFSEKGPIDWFVILTPNSYVETSISESDGISPSKPIKGDMQIMNMCGLPTLHTNFIKRKKFIRRTEALPELRKMVAYTTKDSQD